MALAVVLKDPEETLTAAMDWSARLDSGVTISTSTWTLPAGLTRVADAISGTTTTILLSGGTAGEDYLCTNTITTSDSQTLQRSGPLRVRQL